MFSLRRDNMCYSSYQMKKKGEEILRKKRELKDRTEEQKKDQSTQIKL